MSTNAQKYIFESTNEYYNDNLNVNSAQLDSQLYIFLRGTTAIGETLLCSSVKLYGSHGIQNFFNRQYSNNLPANPDGLLQSGWQRVMQKEASKLQEHMPEMVPLMTPTPLTLLPLYIPRPFQEIISSTHCTLPTHGVSRCRANCCESIRKHSFFHLSHIMIPMGDHGLDIIHQSENSMCSTTFRERGARVRYLGEVIHVAHIFY